MHAGPSVDGAGRASTVPVAASACAIRHRSVRGRARASPPAADPLACAHRPPGRRGEASASLLFGLLISLRRDKFVPPRRAPDRHILNDTRGCGLQASYIAARTHAHAFRAHDRPPARCNIDKYTFVCAAVPYAALKPAAWPTHLSSGSRAEGCLGLGRAAARAPRRPDRPCRALPLQATCGS